MTLELLDAPTTITPRPRKPRAVKAEIRPDASKDKVTLCLSPAANLRLTVHAAGTGMDRSALVERLILEHLRRFVLQDREKNSPAQDGSVGEA